MTGEILPPYTRRKEVSYVIGIREKWNYRGRSNLHPGGDGKGFGRELSA
jgi:hypothetical protein